MRKIAEIATHTVLSLVLHLKILFFLNATMWPSNPDERQRYAYHVTHVMAARLRSMVGLSALSTSQQGSRLLKQELPLFTQRKHTPSSANQQGGPSRAAI
jgi:hypothetical protein